MFGFGFWDVFIIAGVFGVQYFLSTRESFYWGGVLPITFVSWRTWIFVQGNERFLAYILILFLGLAFLLGGWYEGRNALRKKREDELTKMRAHDMK